MPILDKCAKPILLYDILKIWRFTEQKQKVLHFYFFVDVFVTKIQKKLKVSPFTNIFFLYYKYILLFYISLLIKHIYLHTPCSKKLLDYPLLFQKLLFNKPYFQACLKLFANASFGICTYFLNDL